MVLNPFVIGMFFLYFPEDKSEYIPAVISMSIFVLAAVAVFLFFKKISKREAENIERKYKEMKK